MAETESVTSVDPRSSSLSPSPGWGWGLLVLIFRLLLLGVSSGFAFLLGIAVASMVPGSVEEPPFVERVVRQGNTLLSGAPPETPSIPPPILVTPVPPSPDLTLPAPPSDAVSSTPSSPPLELSDEERDRLQAELDQLETDVQALRDRAVDLEAELGTDGVMDSILAPLDQRIEQLRQRLDPSADLAPDEPSTQQTPPEAAPETDSDGDDGQTAPSAVSPAPPAASSTVDPNSSFITPSTPSRQRPGIESTRSLVVTLPLDVLFATDSSTLPPQTTAILDSVANDLRSYPGAAILVGAHGDDTLAPAESRIQSFEQAKAVQTYLAQALRDSEYHWVVVGYGQTYPAVQNATPGDRQRNRRLEITIIP